MNRAPHRHDYLCYLNLSLLKWEWVQSLWKQKPCDPVSAKSGKSTMWNHIQDRIILRNLMKTMQNDCIRLLLRPIFTVTVMRFRKSRHVTLCLVDGRKKNWILSPTKIINDVQEKPCRFPFTKINGRGRWTQFASFVISKIASFMISTLSLSRSFQSYFQLFLVIFPTDDSVPNHMIDYFLHMKSLKLA